MFTKTKRHLGTLLVVGFASVLAGCSRTDARVEAAGIDGGAEQKGFISRMFSTPRPVTIPEGTVLEVRLDQALSSKQQGPGSEFMATVSSPVVVEGKTVIPRGAVAHGRVVDAHEGGHLEGVSRLGLELDSVDVEGKSYSLDTNEIRRAGQNHKKRNWILIGGGTGLGALIGGIAGGGKGALIGTLAGGGAGTATAAATGKKDVYLPAETLLRFKLDQPVSIPIKG